MGHLETLSIALKSEQYGKLSSLWLGDYGDRKNARDLWKQVCVHFVIMEDCNIAYLLDRVKGKWQLITFIYNNNRLLNFEKDKAVETKSRSVVLRDWRLKVSLALWRDLGLYYILIVSTVKWSCVFTPTESHTSKKWVSLYCHWNLVCARHCARHWTSSSVFKEFVS